MGSTIEDIVERVRAAHPEVSVRRHSGRWPADDTGLWFFKGTGGVEVQIESSTGEPPFLVESSAHPFRAILDTAEAVARAVVAALQSEPVNVRTTVNDWMWGPTFDVDAWGPWTSRRDVLTRLVERGHGIVSIPAEELPERRSHPAIRVAAHAAGPSVGFVVIGLEASAPRSLLFAAYPSQWSAVLGTLHAAERSLSTPEPFARVVGTLISSLVSVGATRVMAHVEVDYPRQPADPSWTGVLVYGWLAAALGWEASQLPGDDLFVHVSLPGLGESRMR